MLRGMSGRATADREAIAGVRDTGVFTRRALREAVAGGERWAAIGRAGLAVRGGALLEALGFAVEVSDGRTALLRAREGRPVAVAVVLEKGERADVGSRRFVGMSPVLYGLARADAEQVGFVIVIRGDTIRLYAAAPGFGVARRGRTDAYVEIELAALQEPALLGLFSAEGLAVVEALRRRSREYADESMVKLRATIVARVVPGLAAAELRGRSLAAPTPAQLDEVYAAALDVLFCGLFAAVERGSADEILPPELADVEWSALATDAIGALHEGLMGYRLAIAAVDLAAREGGARGHDVRYMPARTGDKVAVAVGAPYLEATSGERKFLGSYYTGRQVIDHLLDHGLERGLAEHVGRLARLDEEAAGRGFFEFHVGDLALGAGNFLVAAVDRIERALGNALVARPLPAVLAELARMRATARAELGREVEIDDGRLLRWMIARRCIHGVDRNPGAVLLARRALQVHAFVPGLPPAVDERQLVVGDSLVGVGSVEEVADSGEIRRKLAEVTERAAAALFDVVIASRVAAEPGMLAEALRMFGSEPERLPGSEAHARALAAIAPLRPLHLPLAFPRVFARTDRPGFDVIVGNPPWEEATLERDDFWSRWSPGLQGIAQHRREATIHRMAEEHPQLESFYKEEVARSAALRRVLTCGDYPGMGTGDPDLYKAFAWRLWRLLAREGGRLALVLPRSALAAKGSAAWRAELLGRGRVDDITLLVNRGGWVFGDVHPQYTVALISAAAGGETTAVPLRGPFDSESGYRAGGTAAMIPRVQLAAASEDLALPLLPTAQSVEIWSRLRQAPRLDCDRPGAWRVRAVSELHATQEKIDPATRAAQRPVALMHFVEDRPRGYWPVYKGESFDIWRPDRGRCYAWAEPRQIREYLQAKRLRAGRGSPFAEMSAQWRECVDTLPCLRPRIAFRDVTRATDSRTVRAALVPAEVVLTNTAPYLLWPRGDARDEAFLLGVLCSLPLDWYARRYVETHLNFHVLNALPIPRPAAGDVRRERVIALAGRLAAREARFVGWAREVGVDCGALSGDEEDELVAELDAVVARLYGLDRGQLTHVFETFHDGRTLARLPAVLRHFDRVQ
jgi:hypothetical protein